MEPQFFSTNDNNRNWVTVDQNTTSLFLIHMITIVSLISFYLYKKWLDESSNTIT